MPWFSWIVKESRSLKQGFPNKFCPAQSESVGRLLTSENKCVCFPSTLGKWYCLLGMPLSEKCGSVWLEHSTTHSQSLARTPHKSHHTRFTRCHRKGITHSKNKNKPSKIAFWTAFLNLLELLTCWFQVLTPHSPYYITYFILLQQHS